MPETRKDYAKFAVINRRGRARVARGLSYFNPRRSVGQPQQDPGPSTPRREEDADEPPIEIVADTSPEEPSGPAPPESAATTPVKKRQRLGNQNIEEGISSLQNPASYANMDAVDAPNEDSSNTPAVGASGVTVLPMWKTPQNHETVISFERTFDVFSWAHSWLWEDVKSDTAVVGKFLTTSFMHIFNNTLCSYISPAEFETLPQYARAVKTSVNVTYNGAEPSFETGSTLTGNASINHIIYGGVAHGLNREFNVIGRQCNYKQGTMTLETTNNVDYDGYKKMIYGNAPGTADCQNEFPACFHLPRNYPAYSSIVTNYAENDRYNLYGNRESGAPDLSKFINKFKASNAEGHTFSWNHNVQCGYLKVPPKTHGILLRTDKYYNFNAANPGQQMQYNASGNLVPDYLNEVLHSKKIDLGKYDQIVEKAGFLGPANNTLSNVSIVDSLSLGLFPVPNNCKDCANTFVNCKGHWTLTFKIVIEIGRDSHNTYNVMQSHEREFFGLSGLYNPGNFYNGLYTDSGSLVMSAKNYHTEMSNNNVKGITPRIDASNSTLASVRQELNSVKQHFHGN